MKTILVPALFATLFSYLFAFQPSQVSLSVYQRNRVHHKRPSQTWLAAIEEDAEEIRNGPAKTCFDMSLSLIGSTTSAAVSLTFFTFLAWKRDALMVTFFIGSISNGILSKLLKRVINQTRPVELASESSLQRKPSDNGMPSSHAMSLGFIATFTAICLPWTAILLIVYTFVSLYYRIKVNLHTWQQVLVGMLVGSTNGFLWHRLCQTTALMNWMTSSFLGADGLLPVPMLIVPIVLGAMTVGSLERRLKELIWWKTSSTSSKKDA